MKKILIILSIVLTSLSSCDSYLEVNPSAEIDADNLFEKEAGFQNALNGIYQLCSESSLYGKNLSWGALSVMAQQYDNSTINGTTMLDFSTNEYTSIYTEQVVENIWESLYNVISNCNKLIYETEKASPKIFLLDTVTKNLILGEALAVRAFCHMDIARLFGMSPSLDDNTIMLPYQNVYPSDYVQSYNTKELIKMCIDDLLRAKQLVAYNDLVLNTLSMSNYYYTFFGSADLKGTTDPEVGGSFFNFRGTRMNYMAITGLLARAYNYIGDNQNALIYAEEIYDQFYKEKQWLYFNPSDDYSDILNYKEKKHLADCMFGFYQPNLVDDVETFYETNDLYVSDIENIYADDMDDYRLYLIAEDYGDYTYSYKYRSVDLERTDESEGRIVPILRLSEIFYIMAQSYFDENPAKSLELINELRTAHGCKRTIESISGRSELNEILINDARREFIGEGELFYMYKYLNHAIMAKDGNIQPEDKIFRFEVPYSQTIN